MDIVVKWDLQVENVFFLLLVECMRNIVIIMSIYEMRIIDKEYVKLMLVMIIIVYFLICIFLQVILMRGGLV